MVTVGETALRMTLDEWAGLEEDEPGELVDGLLVAEEDVGAAHEALVIWLAFTLRTWLGRRGRVLASDTKYAVAKDRGRKPDLSVYFTRAALPARKVVRTPPDVAVEIVSPTPGDRRRDRLEKLREYAAFGIRFYWIVDPETRTVEMLELSDGRYAIALAASTGVVAPPGCEGLVVDIDAMWAEIDDLDDG